MCHDLFRKLDIADHSAPPDRCKLDRQSPTELSFAFLIVADVFLTVIALLSTFFGKVAFGKQSFAENVEATSKLCKSPWQLLCFAFAGVLLQLLRVAANYDL
jgi:hypothetical protein